MNRKTHFAAFLVFILISCLGAKDTIAQTGNAESASLQLVDWEFAARGFALGNPDASIQTFRFRGRVPLESLLPQTTPDSRIHFLSLAAGRHAPGQDTQSNRGAWHLTLLDLSLQRAWWSGAVTMVDLASDVFEKETRTWVEAGTGPGFHFQKERVSVSATGQVFGGVQSVELYSADDSDLEGSGFHGGIRLSAGMRWERLTLQADWQKTGFTGGNLSLDESSLGIAIQLTERWRLGGLAQRIAETGPKGAMDGPTTQIGMDVTYRLNRR